MLTWAGAAAATVTMATVPVGNAGNADDPSMNGPAGSAWPGANLAMGGVDYEFEMGKSEVSNLQYVEFLNAVASVEDTYGLYSAQMEPGASYVIGNAIFVTGIVQSGSPGSFSYSVAAGYEGLPVNYIDYGDAIRFANWMHNGQPVGNQDAGTTEDGSYFINGMTFWGDFYTITRKPGATWVIPTGDEWYKAGHHQNNGVTGDYYRFATGSDTAPIGEMAPGGANSANYQYAYDGQISIFSPVGSYSSSASPYGVKDMVGNVREWVDEPQQFDPCWWNYNVMGLMGAGSHEGPPEADADIESLIYWDATGNYPTGMRLAFIGAVDDSDGDGVIDIHDECPNTPGGTGVNAAGCPDADGDGVADADDLCPGSDPCYPVDADGCLDTDGDGVADTDDICPDTDPCYVDIVNAWGCSDEDGDGILDPNDLCWGTPPGAWVDANGCEIPDEDNDGVSDACDLCPATPPGTAVGADGCPLVGFLWVMDVTASQWADYNDDGYSDMFGGMNLYTNQQDGTFMHTTPFGGREVGSVGDYNNDGLVDVASLGTYGVGGLFFNNGDETWTYGGNLIHWTFLDTPRNSNGQTCVDLNGDGYLDTYMTGWWDYDQTTSADVIYTSEVSVTGDPCWRKTWEETPYRHCKGVTPCDFDEDGDQDLYVSGYWLNLGHLWRNDGFDGATGLTDVAGAYGVNDGPGHTQGSCWADFDNDGHFDLFVANFAHPGNPSARFMQSNGPPSHNFTDKGLCGITQVEPLSGGIAGDYDNDGDVDILITVSSGYSWQHIMLYRNNGDWTFTEETVAMGLGSLGPADIAAWGDYNNDGALDLIAAEKLWQNHNETGNHWLKVRLKGGPHADGLVNGAAIGAQVRIDVPGLGTLTRQVEGNTGQVGCQNDITMHFGLGSHTGPVDLLIDWPNGYQETVYDVAVDQAITIQLEPPITIPLCWNYLTQCHGDTDDDGDVDTVDWPVFRDAFGYAYPVAQYHPCADLDHDGDVDTADWPEFRDNFGYPATPDCTPGGTWPPTP